jgi:hypothetical protein
MGRFELLDAAADAYDRSGGKPIARSRVLLYNAACALMFLAYRMGTRPEDLSCGRDLAGDLRWSTESVSKALFAREE